MLELKTGYSSIVAMRDEISPDWVNVRMTIIKHKPFDKLLDDVYNLDWLVFTAIEEELDSTFNAESALEILSKPEAIIKINTKEFPIIKDYSFHIDDIKRENQIEKEMIVYMVMTHPQNSGFLTEESLITMEVIRYVRQQLPWIDFWG